MLLMTRLHELNEKSDVQIKLLNEINTDTAVISEDTKHIKRLVENVGVQNSVLKRVFKLVSDVDNTLADIFKKLANNSSKAKEVHYPIKRRHGKKF